MSILNSEYEQGGQLWKSPYHKDKGDNPILKTREITPF